MRHQESKNEAKRTFSQFPLNDCFPADIHPIKAATRTAKRRRFDHRRPSVHFLVLLDVEVLDQESREPGDVGNGYQRDKRNE